jgi:hypothetical protein
LLASQFALYRIQDRFADDPMKDGRVTFARNTLNAAIDFMPFGAGVGTFVPVYAMFEEPSDMVGNFYINHAHNDFLEVWLETGFFGMALFAAFAIVLGIRTVELWRTPPDKANELDRLLMRAATLALPLLIAHSVVEYPLRTGAIMAIFAFACALLIEPLAVAEKAMMATAESRRVGVPPKRTEGLPKTTMSLGATQYSSAVAARSAEISQPLSQQPAGRWGEEIEWPAEWQKSKAQKPPDAPSRSDEVGPAPSATEPAKNK